MVTNTCGFFIETGSWTIEVSGYHSAILLLALVAIQQLSYVYRINEFRKVLLNTCRISQWPLATNAREDLHVVKSALLDCTATSRTLSDIDELIIKTGYKSGIRPLFRGVPILCAASSSTYPCLEASGITHLDFLHSIPFYGPCTCCDGMGKHWYLTRGLLVVDLNNQPCVSQILRLVVVPYLRGFGYAYF
ncbi:hypothetical protein TNCV_702461 [Trichonephila clavipes]|nr:hypothetical protein TNCV_702461 [Trichonephila clavipes]